jgi:hypothetical protein
MKRSTLLLLIPALILSSCGGDTPVNKDDCYVSYELAASIRKADTSKTGGYNLSFHYKSEYFDADATVFNKDLALLSNGVSMMAESEATIKSFYNSVYFDQIETHYVEHTKDSVCYALASRKYEDYDLISVVVNGYNYGLEWVNNALVGLEGDHEGFSLRANDIYSSLKTFLADRTNYKLWISGYSRGAAIANVLSHYILSKGEIEIAQKDMFVYTFECPKGLDKNNAPEYSNVFNVLYSGDLVTYVGPSEYGFARCGIDIDLYQSSEHTDEVLFDFDEDISIPAFKACEGLGGEELNTEADVCKYLFTYLSREGEDVEGQDLYIHTRADFVNKVQSTVQFVLSAVFSMKAEVKEQLIKDIKELGIGALALMSDPAALAVFLAPYLYNSGIPYTANQLVADCKTLIRLIGTDSTLVSAFLAYFLTGQNDLASNLIRSIKVHYPEVGHALLKDYLSNLE